MKVLGRIAEIQKRKKRYIEQLDNAIEELVDKNIFTIHYKNKHCLSSSDKYKDNLVFTPKNEYLLEKLN